MIQKLPFTYPGIDGDVGRLALLLRAILTSAGVTFPSKAAVLNLACGRADETGALIAALKPADVTYYLGIDLRPDAIAEARSRWELPGGEIEFREGNAATIGRMKHLPRFDLVFIRHQNYWHEPMVWEGIIDEALAALTDAGKLVCTSYFDHEHELLLAGMRTRGVRILSNIRNPSSRILPDAEGKSVDRWIAVLVKSPPRAVGQGRESSPVLI